MKKNKEKIFEYLFMCHRIPSRSFFYKGKQFPICARCTGLLIGYILFIPLVFFIKPTFYRVIYFVSPMVIDGLIQRFTKYESNNMLRLITGILGGLGILFSIYWVIYMGYLAGQELGSQLK